MRIIVFAFLLFLNATVHAQTIPGGPHIVVNGHAERSVKPDKFILPMEITTISKDPSTAEQIERQTLALVAQLKKMGVKDEDIKVDNLAIDKEYDDKQRYLGNYYTRNIKAGFLDKQTLISFLSSINDLKNLEIGAIEREIKDIDALMLDLMKDAVANSKLRAENLAALYGMRVLGVHTISTSRISGDEGSYAGSARSLDRVQVTGSRIKRKDLLPPVEQLLQEGTIDVKEDIYVVFLIGK
jgi:uncharacterized protein YggE